MGKLLELHRKVKKEWEARQPPPKPSLPSQARSYISTLTEHIANGSKHVPEDVRQTRRTICNSCDRRNAEKDSCTVCGCSLNKTLIGDKLGWAVSSCPLGKWGKHLEAPLTMFGEMERWQNAYHENPAAEAGNTWLPVNGEWIKDPNVWPMFRQMIQEEKQRIQQADLPSGSGDGIVIVGGGKYFAAVYCNVRLLRHIGCKLPIEVWYLGRNNEMPEKWQAILEAYGVVCMDADKVREQVPMRILNGWELKFYAIQQSSFRRVLFLDADCYPMREPSFVFDDPRFLGSGAVFQRDTPNDKYEWIKPEVLEMVGLPRESVWDLESGACLIDKQRWGKALAMTVWLNSYSDLMYQVVYGDKTTPALASRIMGQPYAIPRNAPGGGAWGLMQYWFDGLEMWQHRIHCKPVIQQAHFHSGQNDSRPYQWSSLFDAWLVELKGML